VELDRRVEAHNGVGHALAGKNQLAIDVYRLVSDDVQPSVNLHEEPAIHRSLQGLMVDSMFPQVGCTDNP
jgi:hypothetical protein